MGWNWKVALNPCPGHLELATKSISSSAPVLNTSTSLSWLHNTAIVGWSVSIPSCILIKSARFRQLQRYKCTHMEKYIENQNDIRMLIKISRLLREWIYMDAMFLVTGWSFNLTDECASERESSFLPVASLICGRMKEGPDEYWMDLSKFVVKIISMHFFSSR